MERISEKQAWLLIADSFKIAYKRYDEKDFDCANDMRIKHGFCTALNCLYDDRKIDFEIRMAMGARIHQITDKLNNQNPKRSHHSQIYSYNRTSCLLRSKLAEKFAKECN